MTTPRLNDDCIHCILNYLQNNRSTLYNCLLVNRFWCKSAVPLLYTDPFSRLTYKSSLLIIKTFLLCLNGEERIFLTEQNKKFNRNLFQIDDLKPIFEYPKYIKRLSKICDAIDRWYKQQIKEIKEVDKTSDNSMSLPIKATFYHMFLRQNNYIKGLDICESLFNQDIFDIHILNISNLVTTLELHYYDNVEKHEGFSEFLRAIAKNCKNLDQLSLLENGPYSQDEAHLRKEPYLNEIPSIIKQQCGLKKFSYYGYHKYSYYKLPPSQIFFSSLEFQKNSLVSLKLYEITLQKSIAQSIIKLHNLKSLEFNIVPIMSLECCEVFEFASFELKELSFIVDWKNSMIRMIKYLGTTLQRLKISQINTKIMEAVVQYCLDLETFDIYSGERNLSGLSYFKNLKIKTLNIHGTWFSPSLELFFIKLAENLSKTTTKVSFLCHIMKKTILLSFLSSCHSHLITLNFSNQFYFDFEMILNYIKNNNNLKYLGFRDLDKIRNTKNLDSLNQITRRGIQLVEFSDNYKESDYSFSD